MCALCSCLLILIKQDSEDIYRVFHQLLQHLSCC